MTTQKTIICAFCQGTGKNPHFTGTCPVCKGRGENQIKGKFTTCQDCRGSGQKGGTTLTCYTCGGLGVVPDTTEIFKRAKKEIKKAREEMDKERQEFREKSQSKKHLPARRRFASSDAGGRGGPTYPPKPRRRREALLGRWRNKSEDPKGKIFCQSCANRVEKSSTVKICLECFKKIRKV